MKEEQPPPAMWAAIWRSRHCANEIPPITWRANWPPRCYEKVGRLVSSINTKRGRKVFAHVVRQDVKSVNQWWIQQHDNSTEFFTRLYCFLYTPSDWWRNQKCVYITSFVRLFCDFFRKPLANRGFINRTIWAVWFSYVQRKRGERRLFTHLTMSYSQIISPVACGKGNETHCAK